MANYFWLPYYDETWFNYLNNRTGVNEGAKLLPFANSSTMTRGVLGQRFAAGEWAQMVEEDHIQIATHGRKYTTDTVAWDCKGGLIAWTPDQMADVLQGFLGSKRIHYDLLACFGANSWGLAASFGEKLLAAMKKKGLKGTLTALKGATNIGAGQGRQTGTSRFSTGIKMLKIQMPAALGGYVLKKGGTDSGGVQSSAARVQWDL